MYYPCPQTFYFATNSTQYLPAFRLGYLQTCIFSINSTQEIKLTINRVNKTSNFGIKVYETKSFPDPYEKDLEGQLAKIERYSPFNSFPLIVTSRTESVSVLISSFDLNNSIIPYEIEFIAVKHECKCGDTYLKADINELSGRITAHKTIKSTQNMMAITFHSDIDTQMSGFALWYKAEYSLKMFLCKRVFILLLPKLLIPIIFAELATETNETIDSNDDCDCPNEKIFDSNVTEVFQTEENYDTLDVYQTRWNGSNLMKVKQASFGGSEKYEMHSFSSSINGGLLFNFNYYWAEKLIGFEISFSRRSENIVHNLPCPQPFYIATNSHQSLPIFPLGFLKTCILSINATKALMLTINRVNKTSNFGIKVFETGCFPYSDEEDNEGQLAKIEEYSSFNSYPLIVTSKTKSVSVLISSFNLHNAIIPYEIKFVAVGNDCKCFPTNLKVDKSLNLLSPGFPKYCDNLNCSTEISLVENLFYERLYPNSMQCLQIQFNFFETQKYKDLLHLKMPDEKKGLISNKGKNAIRVANVFNFVKECLCHDTLKNLKILDGKKNSVEKKLDVKKCPFMDCFWEIQPPKVFNHHQLIVKFNLSLVDNGTFVSFCPKNFPRIYSSCHRLDSKEVGFEKRFDFFIFVSTFSKRNASVKIWYHREYSPLDSQEIINLNIPRQINFNYEWKEGCDCGDTHLKANIENWEVLYSPDHPSKYCASMNCLWHLEAPEGYHIVLNISKFSGLIKFNNTIQSKQNIMTISFHSDIDTQMSGFALCSTFVRFTRNKESQQQHILLISIYAESSNIKNDSSCPKEMIFDSNVKQGVIKSPGCEYSNNTLL
uniref:CUB domain-containing protein n=1 Tax=Meloidogyne floridensis TaxID=298350 RepID=A0A915NBZ6_9BILA